MAPNQPVANASEVIDFRELGAAIRSRLGFIAFSGVAVFVLVMMLTLLLGMQFRAVGQLYLGEVDHRSHVASDQQAGIDLAGESASQVAAEMEIVHSRSLVRRAVLESGLNVSLSSIGGFSLPWVPYAQWRLQRRDLRLVDGLRSEIRAVDTMLSDAVRSSQSYRLRFLTSTDYELWSETRRFWLWSTWTRIGAGKLDEPFHTQTLTLHLVRGESDGPRAGAQYSIVIQPTEAVIDDALRTLHVATPKNTSSNVPVMNPGDPVNVVSLDFENSSPWLASTFLQKLMTAYIAERQSWKTEEASAAETFVTNQLQVIRQSLDEIQQKLANFKSSNPVVVLDDEARTMVEQVSKYEEQRASARLQVAAFADITKALKSPNPPIGAYFLGDGLDPVLANMANSLTSARGKLTDLESRYHESAPDVSEQRAQVAAQLDEIRSYAASRLTRARENLESLNSIIGQFQDKLKTVPGAELILAQLSRESEVYSKTYSYLLERQQEAAIIKASTLSKNRILDAPIMPLTEGSPSIALRFLSLPVGFVLAIGVVLAQTLLAGTIQSVNDVQRMNSNSPILAMVPRRSKKEEKQSKNGKGAANWLDISLFPSQSLYAEAFRTARARLYAWNPTGQGQMLVLTSPSHGDGKTTCAFCLASALAVDGKSAIVIDANLRSGDLKGEANDDHPLGLRNVLLDDHSWQSVVRQVHQSASKFYFLPTGGSDRPELLTSDRMRQVLSEMRAMFDIVILDCPSFPSASDALALARWADATITVIRPGNTEKAAAVEHLAHLSQASPRHAIMFNGTRADSVRKSAPRNGTPGQSVQESILVASTTGVGPDGPMGISQAQGVHAPSSGPSALPSWRAPSVYPVSKRD